MENLVCQNVHCAFKFFMLRKSSKELLFHPPDVLRAGGKDLYHPPHALTACGNVEVRTPKALQKNVYKCMVTEVTLWLL